MNRVPPYNVSNPQIIKTCLLPADCGVGSQECVEGMGHWPGFEPAGLRALGLEHSEEESDWWSWGAVWRGLHGVSKALQAFVSWGESDFQCKWEEVRTHCICTFRLIEGPFNKAEKFEIHLSMSAHAWFSRNMVEFKWVPQAENYQAINVYGGRKSSVVVVFLPRGAISHGNSEQYGKKWSRGQLIPSHPPGPLTKRMFLDGNAGFSAMCTNDYALEERVVY